MGIEHLVTALILLKRVRGRVASCRPKGARPLCAASRRWYKPIKRNNETWCCAARTPPSVVGPLALIEGQTGSGREAMRVILLAWLSAMS